MYLTDDTVKFAVAHEKILNRNNVNGMEIIVIAVSRCSKLVFL